MFKVDFIDGNVITWERRGEKIRVERYDNYNPTFYINGDNSKLFKSRPWISGRENVVATKYERWRPGLSGGKTKVLRIDVSSEEKLMDVIRDLKSNFDRNSFRFYNVDFSPQFRFCLEKGLSPVPEEELQRIDLKLDRRKIADRDLSGLKINGERYGTERKATEMFRRKIRSEDPDVIMVNRGELLKLLRDKMPERFSIGRTGSFQKLAGENTVSSYGKTVHSNSRFNVPGRAVIDRSNSFLLGEATFEGLWDLVGRSYRPVQELAWASIGRVLTSIEVKKAMEKDILTPWRNWEPETPKKAETLHRADRGGFIFSPEPGVYKDVYEADFASLFPNIMVEKNISPETVCCECCKNSKVPELNYSICERRRGFISEVLEPLVNDRQRMKQKVEGLEGRERRRVQGGIDAIKWLLVSCFGYMGHAHASYGSIECHQAIQAYDREIMLDAKKIFEDEGYKVIHGIIDSIWVKDSESSPEITEICGKVTERIGIEMEYEDRFEWVAFVPRSSSPQNIGALNRYFGKREDGSIKTAGIEAEQDSKPEVVKSSQIDMIRSFDRGGVRSVIKCLEKKIGRLQNGDVAVEDLIIRKKASKSLEQYKVRNRTVDAIKRAKNKGIEIKPGQEVSFVVRNDNSSTADRVRLSFEAEGYDTEFYREQLIRAAESVLYPKGLDREDIRRRIRASETSLARF